MTAQAFNKIANRLDDSENKLVMAFSMVWAYQDSYSAASPYKRSTRFGPKSRQVVHTDRMVVVQVSLEQRCADQHNCGMLRV